LLSVNDVKNGKASLNTISHPFSVLSIGGARINIRLMAAATLFVPRSEPPAESPGILLAHLQRRVEKMKIQFAADPTGKTLGAGRKIKQADTALPSCPHDPTGLSVVDGQIDVSR
jgi:hypothetical protein